MPQDHARDAFKTIFPVQLGHSVRYAQGIKAGPWVFATGHLAQDYRNGIEREVAEPDPPFSRDRRPSREARAVLRNIGAVLGQGGCGYADTVRLDQFYTAPASVVHYQRERRQLLTTHIPPSTSVIVKKLALPGACLSVDAIAYRADETSGIVTFDRSDIAAAKSSGYKPSLRAGPLVFVAGATAEAQAGEPSIGGIATDAHPHEGRRWQSAPTIAQTRYVMERKLIPALELAGSSLANVVKAQVYLTDKADLDFFAQVWFDYFGDKPPATTVIPCPESSLAVEAACVEVNLVAVADDAGLPVERFGQGLLPGFDHLPAAIKAGDLLFISGLLSCGPNGLAATRDLRQPYFTSHPQAQAENILATAEQLCAMAGTSLKRVVRAYQFQTDMNEFYAIHQAWRAYAPDLHVPFSAIEMGSRFPVQDTTILMDLWVHAPDEM